MFLRRSQYVSLICSPYWSIVRLVSALVQIRRIGLLRENRAQARQAPSSDHELFHEGCGWRRGELGRNAEGSRFKEDGHRRKTAGSSRGEARIA